MVRKTLSFCIYTRGPAERLHAMLSLMRPIADEIVLAVDNTSGAETMEACAGLADKRFELESGRITLYLEWLFNQCTSDWILRLDEDELPSRALLDALPELITEPRPVSIMMSRRWLYPDTKHFITNHPWTPDYQAQLIKNVPGIWSTSGRIHEPIRVWGEQKQVDLPIYHCPLVLLPLSSRRGRRRRYDAERPGLATEGFPINAMYTPEDFGDIVTAPVPDTDRAIIESVLGGSMPTHDAPARAPVRAVPFREANQFAETREVSEGAYRAKLELLDAWPEMSGGSERSFEMLVENLGDEIWPWAAQSNPPIRLGYQWVDPESGETLAEGRTLFNERVFPGQTTRLFMRVEAPPTPGRYVLKADVVHDFVRWFDCAVEREVVVTDSAIEPRDRPEPWWRPKRFRRAKGSVRELYRPPA